tara:strand:+ start:8603 stop:8953 length:351 start_codon:yes stop_codon:yes gene_type:complete
MSNKNNNKVYSLPIDALEELLSECKIQFSFSEELLFENLLEGKKNKDVIGLLCEFYASSRATERHLENALENYIEEEDEGQVYISSDIMMIVESALISRYLVSKELTRYNISLAIN